VNDVVAELARLPKCVEVTQGRPVLQGRRGWVTLTSVLALALTGTVVDNGVTSGDSQWTCRLGFRHFSFHCPIRA
jgi:hypothetical protein